ncbi:MAG: hypothetical protein FWE91_11865 [Defluviitaleaceae bacterium]|nr:hypothetical protein [Defluviitaleaceae bacterium]MCL2836736.1 hypothetical protein [Defluviitaleaceae bacterium]
MTKRLAMLLTVVMSIIMCAAFAPFPPVGSCVTPFDVVDNVKSFDTVEEFREYVHECSSICNDGHFADVRTLKPGIVTILPADDADYEVIYIHKGIIQVTRDYFIDLGVDIASIELFFGDDQIIEVSVMSQEWHPVNSASSEIRSASSCGIGRHTMPIAYDHAISWSHRPTHPNNCTRFLTVYWRCHDCGQTGQDNHTNVLWCTG